MAWIADHARFMLSFVRHPFTVGAVVPSSRWLARRIVADMDLSRAATVVEIGPGTGAFTGLILEELPPQSWFMAIELDRLLSERLRERFPKARIVNDSAEHLLRHLKEGGRDGADAIISSLPWAGFPPELQRTLMTAMVAGMKPGAKFATFAYLHASWLRAAHRFRDLLGSTFTSVSTTRVVWRNLPPAFVYRCVK